MKKPGFEFTLQASKTNLFGQIIERPFTMQIAEGDPRLPKLQSSTAFKSKPCMLVVSTDAPAQSPEEDKKEEKMETTEELILEGIADPIIELLVAAGFTSAKMILSEEVTHENLTEIKGIGTSTADKIIEACQVFMDDLDTANSQDEE